MHKGLSRIDRASFRASTGFYQTKPISGFEMSGARASRRFCETKPIHVQAIDTDDLEVRAVSGTVGNHFPILRHRGGWGLGPPRPRRNGLETRVSEDRDPSHPEPSQAAGKRSGLSLESGGDEPRRPDNFQRVPVGWRERFRLGRHREGRWPPDLHCFVRLSCCSVENGKR
jgi:hypothetical protein